MMMATIPLRGVKRAYTLELSMYGDNQKWNKVMMLNQNFATGEGV
jgi:hypothetical protein